LLNSIDYPIDRVVIQIGSSDPKIVADIVDKIKETQNLNKTNLNIEITTKDTNPGNLIILF
jgi:hypothetical protein